MRYVFVALAGAAIWHGLSRQDEFSLLQGLLFLVLAKLEDLDTRR